MIPLPADFEPWLNRLPGFEDARVVSIVPVDGGASNITCRVELLSSGARYVCLRLQRERGIFEPYDVIREGRVLQALARSEIPVPQLLASEPSREHLGAPFILMAWVDAPHMGVAPDASFAAFTGMVVRIHSLNWRSVGMAFLGVPESVSGAIHGEIDAVAARMSGFKCDTQPLLGAALDTLRGAVPADGRIALCQGDINVFNYLFRHGKVVSVVDWEQARLSDPRSDIGQLLALSHLKGAPFGPAEAMPFAGAYAASSGTALAGLAFFRAFWLFQLGVIYHGWRLFNGGSEPWYTWDHLATLLHQSLAELS
jgi:aminoglycoside phosphotransferase (APT) family kinase protein